MCIRDRTRPAYYITIDAFQTTPNDERRKNAAESSNSHTLSNNEKNIASGVNSLFGKSLPDLTSVAVRPKYARPIPYSTRWEDTSPEYCSICKALNPTLLGSESWWNQRDLKLEKNKHDTFPPIFVVGGLVGALTWYSALHFYGCRFEPS